ncbi:MAG TPA: sulfur oxidation c-type cytochrome SoxX [Thiotrichales bacterium]|nr:sulfur oxidation c-type cytochrome SoxX [Thiotrichales bacterium]
MGYPFAVTRRLLPLLFLIPLSTPAGEAGTEPYIPWTASDDYAIEEPLGGLVGDPARGREIARDRGRGNCIACHLLPIPEEPDHGTVGPPLIGVGSRLTEGQIRLRVVDEQRVNPPTIMPAFYRDPARLTRVDPAYRGKTLLTAQEVEDLVAWLKGLK